MGLASFNRMRRRQAELLAQAEAEAHYEIPVDPQQEPGADEVLTDESDPVDLDELSYPALKDIAKDRGVPFVGVKKEDLIEAIKASE